MQETELETSRITISQNHKRIEEIEKWFRYEYPARLNTIQRYTYLGIKLPETRYHLEMEAYEKENELRALKGKPELPKPNLQSLL